MKYKGKGRIVLCFLLCMLMALPVGIGSAAAVKAAEQQTIIIGTNAEYSPFEYLDDNGNIIKEFDSITAAVQEIGVSSKSIRDAANGVQKRAGGYHWMYKT